MNNHQPLVSIVIPTFNRANLVQKAIETSLVQTYPCEVIVCDHGSSDDTPDIVKKYEDKLKYIRKEKDFGPHFCWLEGILNASGEYVHIQFDDDWLDESYIEELMELFNQDVGCVFCNANIVNLETHTCSQMRHLKKRFLTGIYSNKILEKVLMNTTVISPGCCIFRKDDIINALYLGSLPVKNLESYHGVGPDVFMMLLTMLKYSNFGYVNKALAFLGDHDDSITINAGKSKEKRDKIQASYNNMKIYYLGLQDIGKKWGRYTRKFNWIKGDDLLRFRFILRPIENAIKMFRK